MRLNTLFAVVAPIVMLLPLSAHADWPKGEREKYMAQCTEAATQQIGAAAAKAHCACGADAIKSYPASDLQALMDKHFAIVARFYVPSRDAYVGTALFYADNADMKAFHNTYHPRMVEFLCDAAYTYALQNMQ